MEENRSSKTVILGLEPLEFSRKIPQRILTRGSNTPRFQIPGSKNFYRFSSKNEEILSPRMTRGGILHPPCNNTVLKGRGNLPLSSLRATMGSAAIQAFYLYKRVVSPGSPRWLRQLVMTRFFSLSMQQGPALLAMTGGAGTTPTLPKAPSDQHDDVSPLSRESSLFAGEQIHLYRLGRLLYPPFSFSLKPGDIFLIQGINGSGKSSFLRLLAGLLPLSAGTFFWKGEKISTEDEAHHKRVAYLGHQQALEPHLTVLELLQKSLLLSKSPHSLSDILEKLRIFHLDALQHIPLQFLSQGQRQRVALCRISLLNRPLWLLDEPTSHLDGKGKEVLMQEIKIHTKAGGIVFVASHGEDFS